MRVPNLSNIILKYSTPVRFTIISKRVQDFEVQEVETIDGDFLGSLQPLDGEELLIKPEGQRHWEWWTLYTPKSLEVDMIVESERGERFRIVDKYDWTEAGYYKYGIKENIEGSE